ncbi:MAG: DUF4440 domain-containing protein, partial [Parvularculaceae bacterium]|nr:DUF4440 domain-containing protein [Parvularculaceae bacterium]
MTAFVALSILSLAAAAAPSGDACAVFARERSFADSVERHDAAAFAEHLRADAVFAAATPRPVRGREAILADWAGIIRGDTTTLRWRPRFVTVSGDVALSRGPYVLSGADASGRMTWRVGEFASVWTRGPDGWKVLFDGGGPPPRSV